MKLCGGPSVSASRPVKVHWGLPFEDDGRHPSGGGGMAGRQGRAGPADYTYLAGKQPESFY